MTAAIPMAEAASAVPLRYEDVPQRAQVERNGDLVELVMPGGAGWWVWVVRQAIAGTLLVVVLASLYMPIVAGGFAWMLWLVLAAFLVVFGVALIHRLLKAPRVTVLRWDGDSLSSLSYVVAIGADRTAGDPLRWSRAALADLEVKPLWPAGLTGCATVKIVSRFDYAVHLGVSPVDELKEAVAEFRDIVLAQESQERYNRTMPPEGTERLLERIARDPKVRSGSPVVRGTRITVGDVLWWLASGMSHEEILEDYPDLTEADIRACLAFAAKREQAALPLAS